MRYLLTAVAIVSIVTFVSVYAGAYEDMEPAAKVAPKAVGRVPASTIDSVMDSGEENAPLPPELEGASIEVGYTQDGEPEPHLMAVASNGRVKLFQLEEVSPSDDKALAKRPTGVSPEARFKDLPVHVFVKRIKQAVDEELYFEARQPRRKSGCRDQYVIRIRQGDRFRERRGCTNQSSDAFAAFAQLFFRDAFIVWSRHSSNSSQ